MLALIVDSFVLYFIDAFHSLFPVVGSDRVKTQHENIIMKEKKKKKLFTFFPQDRRPRDLVYGIGNMFL